jgi:hypothetical protein
VIYKLSERVHKDRHDIGSSASFSVGKYSGGEMLFPQLEAKFVYVIEFGGMEKTMSVISSKSSTKIIVSVI